MSVASEKAVREKRWRLPPWAGAAGLAVLPAPPALRVIQMVPGPS